MAWWETHKYPEFARDHQDIRQLVWKGVNVHKKPIDLFYYHEEIYRRQPNWIVETGTLSGGSALFFASCHPEVQVVTIDNYLRPRVTHPRVKYIEASSTDQGTVDLVKGIVSGNIMVSLDSDHSYPHVTAELAMYSPLVTKGQLLVVEDTLNVLQARKATHEFLEASTGFRELEPDVMLTYHTWLESA